ncbi:MAG: fructose PTS transporter subunit IIB [Peptoniphilaceae bacterium]|nr:fructose PTS transporter subunit IIB [Peptoniphilaceae bacterium]MDD7383844.1 fructose PTS transporter subunit IIB [Peptoniphilaceae bacterium]MDY3737579.1 fructose PTS transporter subunit IIB [Peptoniphilaceae bacterium]
MKKFVGLCACTMGLAHTFMAAEAIEKAAKKRGYDVKIETQGSDGIKNELTDYDISKADIILLSTAITPEKMERFEGYQIYEIPLSEAIKRADEVIEEIEEDQKNN